jgi:molybdopterin-guanine dinucleotide biosynthesis protein A
MGRPKAWLRVGTELMLPRVVRLVREAVGSAVVVAAPDQDVPPLPTDVRIVRDAVAGEGPLAGLAAGLAALAGRADVMYLSACDVPLLEPAFVRRVVSLLEGQVPPLRPTPPAPRRSGRGEKEFWSRANSEVSGEDSHAVTPIPEGMGAGGVGSSWTDAAPLAAVPRVGDRLHPLAAAYRIEVLPVVRALLAADRLRLTGLCDAVPTRFIEAADLADIDPAFRSLRNVNAPDEYAAALRELDGLGPS